MIENNFDFSILLPLLIISTAPLVIMILLAIKRSHVIIASFSSLALIAAFLSLFAIPRISPNQIKPLFIIDSFSLFYMGLIITAGFAVTLLSFGYFKKQEENKEEYYILLFLAILGSVILVTCHHFVSFFLGLEILSISLYVLISYLRTQERCIEAGVKYLILAAASSAFLLFGIALVYAELGTMSFGQLGIAITLGETTTLISLSGFALIIVGIGFKLAVVPFHTWTPDVYQGAPAPVTAFIATVSKGGMFALLLRFFIELNAYQYKPLLQIFGIIAIASMFFGNILALLQSNVKRILAYSSIAHLGYLLVAFLASGQMGIEAATFYLVAYFVTTIGAFGVITILSDDKREAEWLEDYQGLYWQRPWIAAIFTAMLLSLAGIPLTAGFVGKFYVVAAGVGSSLWLLVLILVINSAVGLFYYLRIVVAMYTQPAELTEEKRMRPTFSLSGGFVLAAMFLLLIWFGVYPAGMIHFIKTMIASLDFSLISGF